MRYETIHDVRERLAAMVGDIDPASARGKTRRKLLDAAAALFIDHGYRKTNIDDIARRAGVGKGTVYLHFSAKVDLLVAAAAREKLRAIELAAGMFAADMPPRERLRTWVRAALLTVAGSPLLTRLMAGDAEFTAALADLDPALLAAKWAERDEFLGALIDAAVAPERLAAEQRRARIIVLTAITRLAPHLRGADVRESLSVEQFVDAFAGLVVDGIAG